MTYEKAGIYKVMISRDFPTIMFKNEGDKDKLLTVEQWGTQQWVSMYNAFNGCTNLEIKADDNPDLSKATSMTGMFANATNFNSYIGDWNVSNIPSMNSTFYKTSFNQDISRWDVSNVTQMAYMFLDSPFNQPLGDWDVSNVVNMKYMFAKTNFDQDISRWDVSNVEKYA